jgi:hypothetical protein
MYLVLTCMLQSPYLDYTPSSSIMQFRSKSRQGQQESADGLADRSEPLVFYHEQSLAVVF